MKKDFRHLQNYIDNNIKNAVEACELDVQINIEPFFDDMDSVEDIKHDIFAFIQFPSYVDYCVITDDLYLKVKINEDYSGISDRNKEWSKQQEEELEELKREYMESRGL